MAQEGVEKQSTEPTGQVILQILELAEAAKSADDKPNFGFIERFPEWHELKDKDRLNVLDYARGVGFVNLPESVQVTPKHERLNLKRLFLGYDISLDEDGGLKFSERVIERAEDGEEEKVRSARFVFPIDVTERLASNADLRDLFSARLTELRLEVDGGKGVKLFIDRPKDNPDKLIPKWKYRVSGKTREDVFGAEELPGEVAAAVKKGGGYWKERSYRSWFGRSMQYKREEILVDALLAELDAGDEEPEEQPNETTRKMRAAFVASSGKVGKAGLRRGVKEVFIDFAELISDRESAERYRGVLEDFVWTGSVARARAAGHEQPGVSRKEVKDAVGEIIDSYLEGLRRFRGAEGAKPRQGGAMFGGGLAGRVRSLGGRLTKSAKGERPVTGAVIPLPSRGFRNRRSVDLFREVIEDELIGEYDAVTIERTITQISEYVQGRDPVADRFRRQVVGVERGKLVIRDYDLMVAAARKFAEGLKGKK